MRLVIREYLGMLKESGELDVLLSDLVLAMGMDTLTRPAIGSRQFGVDLPAVGVDEGDPNKKRKLFLFTIKRGDISRNDWDTGKQAVRPSLNEILDSYLRNRVRPEHEKLPKKIILATGGELKQDVEPDWVNYVQNNSGQHEKYGWIEFDFWGADKLSRLIERYFLDEYIFPESTQKVNDLFPESAQKKVRKTIALADQNEYEPLYFYGLIEEILFKKELPSDKSDSARRKRQRALRLINLSLNIVFYWCKEAENIRPALLCAERVVLRTWDWMRINELFDCKRTYEEFARIFSTYLKITEAYAGKLYPYCMVRDGLFGHGADEVEYSLRTFDLIGVLGVLTMTLVYLAASTGDDLKVQESFSEEAQAIAAVLISLIDNNPAAMVPRYDGHAIDIAVGLFALTVTGHVAQASEWLEELCSRIVFGYRIGRYFPIASDAYEDLIEMEFGQAPPKEKLMDLSTLLPMLADWYVVLDRSDAYEQFQKAVRETFTQTDLQTWYPDETTDSYLYRANAGLESGITLSSIELPETLLDLKALIAKIQLEQQEFEKLSCVLQGWPGLGLIASRHFRTPVIPSYWRRLITDIQYNTNE